MSTPAVSPPFAVPSELLPTLLAVSLTGIGLLRPVYGPVGGKLVDFAIDYLNPTAQQILGLPEQPEGTGPLPFPLTQAEGVLTFFRRAFASGEADRYDVNYQANGLENYFHLAAQRHGDLLVVSFIDTADRIRSTVAQALCTNQPHEQDGLASEVTEQILSRQQVLALNQELLANNAHLTRTNADLDNFIYIASHDLKTPITNIEGLLDALEEELPAAVRQSDHVQAMLDMMQDAVKRFQLTLVQLTDLSRLQLAHAQPTENVDLTALVESVRLDLASELAAAGTQLTVDMSACPTGAFSAKNMRSIVYNLLSNAIKFRAPGRVPAVSLRCHGDGANTVMEVQDNGLGLTDVQQTKLFGMFQRMHDHVDGSGIGLYMVRKIVENAGGTVSVQSQAGEGSTFCVSFPG